MGLTWVREFCPRARYVLKTDDDAFNVPQRYVDYLLMVDSDEKFIGQVRLRPGLILGA